MRRVVECRIRSATRGEFRHQLGIATSKDELAELYRQRVLLKRLHGRGEADVLQAIKAGRTTVAELARLVDQRGIEDYRAHLALAPERPDRIIPTLDQHAAAWLATITKDGTRQVYRKGIQHLRDFTVEGERLGDRPWPRVARHTVHDAKASLNLAAMTRRTVMAAWSGFFTWAIERDASEAEEQGRPRILETNPVRAARAWDPIETTRHRFLSWEEFHRLLGVAEAPMRAQYATLTLAGLRIEELLTLPPAHVRLPTHLHIGPWGGWAPKGYPRYKHGVRDVPLHRELVTRLTEYAATYAGERTFFVNPTSGEPWTRGAFTLRMERDVIAAGMVWGQWSRKTGELERKRDGITAHSCRHTLASWLASDDVQLMKIAAILGDTVETVERHYAHLLPKDLDQAINRVGKSGETADRKKRRAGNG